MDVGDDRPQEAIEHTFENRGPVEQLALALETPAVPLTIADDDSGRIVYYPSVATRQDADRWFALLREEMEWRRERRPMYDRVVDVPRLVAHYGIGEALPPPIAAAKRLVEELLDERFNAVGLNLYRDGLDSVAMHNDHTEGLEHHSPIAILSLGATRVFRVQTKEQPRRTASVALEPGSVLLMAGASQDCWEHGVPKTRAPVGERISLAFRRCVPKT
jgi:alkylated DNA repair dioxygenase AlkB